jgi:hypothetical protein
MSSIFGTPKSGDEQWRKAIDAFKSVTTPELSALQVQLNQYVLQGRLSPEAAEAVLLNSNAFNDIKLDPSLRAAQKSALQNLQNIATQGGLTATDKAQLNDIAIEQNTVAKGRTEAILENARERGIGGSGLELTSRLMNEQEAANRAATQGTQVAANAEQRALQAIQAAGGLGGQMEAQQYGQEANKAVAQNAIDRFNAETQQNTNMYNVGTANQAQAANLAAQQDVANKNTAVQQQEEIYNKQQVQQDYANKMGKAGNIAGVYQNWAGAKDKAGQAEMGANMAIGSGIANTLANVLAPSASAFGMGASPGGAGGAGGFNPATMSTGEGTPTVNKFKSSYALAEGGKVPDDKMIEFSKDDMIEEHERLIPQLEGEEKEDQIKELADIRDMTNGGLVPGKAKIKGDSLQNDTVPAMLSPGEVVVPRTAVNDEEDFKKFMNNVEFESMACGGKVHMAQGGPVPPVVPLVPPKPPMMPPVEPLAVTPPQSVPKVPPQEDIVAKALKSLQFRVTNLEGSK